MEDMNKNTPVEVVDIQFRAGQKIYYFDPAGKQYHTGDHVIIDTARGPEFGHCTGGNHKIDAREVVAPLRPVLRLATEEDEKTVEKNRKTEKQAYAVCLEKIQEQGLDMQLVSVECAFDGSKILFFFTADERVDFRELVKTLASTFYTRIELRQIGVRDKAKMVGGLGICGRPFCCASFLDDFQPVSIKMAKTQNLSLNPTKISGTCGRLMCCLKYEQDAYEDLLRTAPKADSFVDTPDGRGTVVDVNLLRQQVKVQMESQPEVIGQYACADIAILRNGKAKKNDPPIPADLAPISGGNRRKVQKKEEPEDNAVVLNSIKFRYSTETIAEETVPEQAEEAPKQDRSRSRRNRRNRGGKKPQQPAPAENTEKPEAEKKPARKANYRRRRPKSKGPAAENK